MAGRRKAPVGWKRCNACARTFRVAEFGRATYCLKCMRARSRAYRAANADQCRKRYTDWRLANPEAHRRRNQRWVEAHPEQKRAMDRAYSRENRATINAATREYRRRKPEIRTACDMRRRAMKFKTGDGTVTAAALSALRRRHRGRCAYCKRREADTFDHVIPLVRGGAHTIGNLLPACRSCNSSKRERTLDEWRPT